MNITSRKNRIFEAFGRSLWNTGNAEGCIGVILRRTRCRTSARCCRLCYFLPLLPVQRMKNSCTLSYH